MIIFLPFIFFSIWDDDNQKYQNWFHVKSQCRKILKFPHSAGSSKKKKSCTFTHRATMIKIQQLCTQFPHSCPTLPRRATAFFLKVAMTEKLQVAYFPSNVKVIVCIILIRLVGLRDSDFSNDDCIVIILQFYLFARYVKVPWIKTSFRKEAKWGI